MKPNFALNITEDTLALLHRTPRGWLEIGSAPLDTPDLSEALGYLRRSALGLEPRGMATKLVIPNTEILYLELEAPGPDDIARDGQIRVALEGRTPYEVDDLVFDWSGDGPLVQVAVVARETLREAEEFATNFRLNPVSFAAIPDPLKFSGEPWFGPSDLAEKLLAADDFVERDSEVTQIIARPPLRAADPAAPPVEPPVEQPPETPAEAPVPTPVEDPADPPAEQPPETPAEDPANSPVEDPALPDFDFDEISDLPTTDAGLVMGLDIPELDDEAPDFSEFSADFGDTPGGEATPEVIPPVIPSALVARRAAQETPAPVAEANETAADGADTTADAAPTEQPPRKAPPAPLTSSGLAPAQPVATEYSLQPDPDNEPVAEFFTLHRSPAEAPPPRPALPAALARRAAQLASAPARRPSKAAPPRAPRVTPPISAPAPAKQPAAPRPVAPAVPPVVPPVMTPVMAPVTPPVIPPVLAPVAEAAPKPVPPVVTAPGIAAPPERRGKGKPAAPVRPEPVETLVAPPPEEMAPAMAVPDKDAVLQKARPRPPRRGKPRFLGLALTLGLLLLLALVAAWASYTSNDPAPTAEPAAEAQPDAADLPTPADESAADGVEPGAPTDGTAPTEGAAPAEGTGPAAPLPGNDQSGSAVADPARIAAAQPAVTGRSVAPLPEAAADTGAAPALQTGPRDEITLSTAGATATVLPAAATLVPPQTEADAAPVLPAPPPPFGTQYEFDAAGLIKPTPEGIVTPDGYKLIAGQPPVLPPLRPADLAIPAPAQLAAPEQPLVVPGEPHAELDPPPGADPALQGFRPAPRPAGLVPAVEDAALGAPPADLRLAAAKPMKRPAEIEEQARQRALDDEARRVAEAASLSAAASAAALAAAPQGEVTALPTGGISPLALQISRTPPKRPQDFSAAVGAAVAEVALPRKQAAAPEPEEPARSAATAEPGEDEEPVAAAAKAPKVPTKASVSKQATFANAIDLRKTNLIGVYGTPSKRYAMIRTSTGSYKKVKVGDRIDGGTVAAITDTELRYRKGTRMMTLSLPRG